MRDLAVQSATISTPHRIEFFSKFYIGKSVTIGYDPVSGRLRHSKQMTFPDGTPWSTLHSRQMPMLTWLSLLASKQIKPKYCCLGHWATTRCLHNSFPSL